MSARQRNNLASWRELPLTVVARLRTQLTKEQRRAMVDDDGRRQAVLDGVEGHLQEAEEACLKGSRFRPRSGTLERTWSNIRAAETDLLSLASDDDLRAKIPEVLGAVRRNLPEDSPQRKAVEEIAAKVDSGTAPLTDQDRSTLVRSVTFAYAAVDSRYRRVRLMADLVWIVTGAATLGLVVLAFWGLADEQSLDMCFRPQPPGNRVVCPTGEHEVPPDGSPPWAQAPAVTEIVTSEYSDRMDVLTVECAGLIGAALTVVTAVHRIHANHATIYQFRLPLAVAVLKFPVGALSAVAGILLIKGAFVPGLSNLDSSAQIIGWSIVFGAAQHLVTHIVDQRAEEALSGVRKPP
ncbi:hypothetical protein EJ357_13360 [Streptomyces cyaneochromogenes]|uniref:Uncharacterized protein n=1 Tax=Streptomyces cyaneochromogenes TaxID=2496836 RepID=A0A3Q9ERW3_9ACTN|nr:hypothetical protein [Streptomyces cyaneochromogenes]AZQ34349.1 hypothetical protein EJ357_13360 [Streptomyces cyaneochromogenes]